MNLIEARQFVAHFVEGDYIPEEYEAFLQWLKVATLEELNEIANEHEVLHEQWDVMGLFPTAEWRGQLEEKLDHVAEEVGEEAPVVAIGKNGFTRRRFWVAAASVIVLVGAGAIWYTQQGGTKAERNRQELQAMTKMTVNPIGSKEKEVVLADGSKVLLNVASTLRYPEVFNGEERVVELSGEAYFEVTPNAAKPFRVLIKDAEVDVLGTNFNVRAYADDPVSRTTLIDGSVGMEAGSDKVILKPGQQAVLDYASTGGIAVHNVDVDAVMAWQKGYFRFTNEEFGMVARVLSRYYNVEIQGDQDALALKVSGAVSRDQGLEQSLKQFESTTGLKFSKEENSGGAKIVKVTL
jgi:ferric-dicitrate binding protein FerR (iron transport regulator)